MKKICFILVCFFAFSLNISALERYKVQLYKCVDGDTAWFKIDNKIIKSRFLGINTPESTNKQELYGKDASKYTCNILKNSKNIEVEYDSNSTKLDKYDRHLLWIFVDDQLLQEMIIKKGLGEVKYIYGDYKYLDELYKAEKYAKDNKLNIWSDYKEYDIIFNIFIIIIFIIIMFIIYPKKTAIKKIKKYLK